MSFETNLTVDELAELLIARFRMNQTEQAEMQKYLQKDLGLATPLSLTDNAAISEHLNQWVAGLMAKKLMTNMRDNPFLTEEDIKTSVPVIAEKIVAITGRGLEGEGAFINQLLIPSLITVFYSEINALVLPGRDAYDEHWRWIAIVFNLASEQNISPIELLSMDDMREEITRRQYTKEEFVTLHNQSVGHLTSDEVLTEALTQPFAEMFSQDPDEQKQFVQALGAEFMPILGETIRKIQQAFQAWIEAQSQRIYKTV